MSPSQPEDQQETSLPDSRWRPRKFPSLPPLPPTTRILLLTLGWVLIAVGLVGLVLPGLQGVMTLAAGAAALSLVSQTFLSSLRYLLRPWPAAWISVLRVRRRVHRWLGSR